MNKEELLKNKLIDAFKINMHSISDINELEIYNIYEFGSKVYGVSTIYSDEDYILIYSNFANSPRETAYDFKNEKISINAYRIDYFIKLLFKHQINCMECIYLPEQFILKEIIKFNIPINKYQLRNSISKIVSNSWVKCKKKLEKEHEYYIGKKSLYHSFRILDYGIQIAKYNKIRLYTYQNLWNEIILSEENSWKYFDNKYRILHNKLEHEFKLLSPKI